MSTLRLRAATIRLRAATIGVAARIFTRVGATDFLAQGLSTFMVEMMETANILKHAQEKELARPANHVPSRDKFYQSGQQAGQAVFECLSHIDPLQTTPVNALLLVSE